ncbi:bifunctional peptidase and (3S)-lysyl hydroxylase Jmjd7-like isoform X1 [Portunus trituberculatus]|uniref:bifunctional peptidase and (3S)-lysyl hydroxylase Jmjd7-like isoform X1 n=2 Tax=Portunus trituberculatus TaxID=210409 RepID=UPI001E1CB9E0|nr:bifunctional peptidase and (3S)-lysyl hydroxylase Jmjd7-like isoform X1 [Portunus trituberculatus]
MEDCSGGTEELEMFNPPPEGKIKEALLKLSTEANELYLNSQVPVLDAVPSPLEFYRDWVASNKPVILQGVTKHWPALTKWTPDYLRARLGEKEVSVAVTPNGYADAPNGRYFVMPEERQMKFGKFLDIMEDPDSQPGIFYIQKQNSNFTEEFSEIMSDAAPEIPWFSEALGRSPDAVNFWMGDERAVTSMHKDHYENIYCVIRGYKDFILLPPTDSPWVPYRAYKPATYKETTPGNFTIEPSPGEEVPWICIDPLNPDFVSFPQYRHASPVCCRVKAGEALFLPSLWYHHVRQSQGCLAVNFWYDMEYDLRYNYHKLLQSLSWLREPR